MKSEKDLHSIQALSKQFTLNEVINKLDEGEINMFVIC
jgi:hypothetical protein